MSTGDRVGQIQARLIDNEIDALLVTDLLNLRYLTGFSGTAGSVLVTAGDATFFSDPRYSARAAELVTGAEIVIYQNRLTEVLENHLGSVSRLGFEASTMTVATRDDLHRRLPDIELVSTTGLVEELRRAKDPDEVRHIKDAVRIADEGFSWALEHIVPGMRERDLARDLEMHMRECGAEAVSFEPIVGSGPLSAHIHHTPGARTLEKGDLVLLDFGCKYQGYCSDLTRTIVLGPASQDQRRVYDLVLQANRSGIEAVKAGAPCKDVDAAARSMIEAAGHGDDFGHGLGHGVGLDIHEAPRLNRISDQELRAGDVVTIEPGVYLVGAGGVRIEDCVLVTPDGVEVLSGAAKDGLIEL